MAFSLRSGRTYVTNNSDTNNSDTFVDLTDIAPDIGDELERTQVIDETQAKTPSKPSPASQFVNEIRDAVEQKQYADKGPDIITPNVSNTIDIESNQTTNHICSVCNNDFMEKRGNAIG